MHDEVDARHRLLGLLPPIDWISDEKLREQVTTVWIRMWDRSAWIDLESCPFTKGFLTGSEYSLVKHTRSVTRNALRIADTLAEDFGIESDRDRLLAICLLHDVSKLVEHADAAGLGVKSRVGRVFPHATLGAVVARDVGVDDLICRSIAVHPYHPPHTFLPPACVEQLLQHWADLGTADALFFLRGMPTHMEQRRLFEAIAG